MDILSLQAFIAVARCKSFSRAAEELFITQPAVSKRVASLEEQLGTRLFNRINRQISLTEAGKQLLPKAQELVNQAADMQRFATNLNEDIAGLLSISVSHHIALYRMPPILREFNQSHPNVQLDIHFEDSEQAFHAVERGDIEFAVITLPKVLPPNLSAETAWQDDLEIVVGLDHPLTETGTVKLANLANYPCVLPSRETETYQIMQREIEAQNLSINTQMTTNNLQSLKMLVEAGMGWSLLPVTMLDPDLKVLDSGHRWTRNLGLVVHKKRSLSNAAQAMRKLLLDL